MVPIVHFKHFQQSKDSFIWSAPANFASHTWACCCHHTLCAPARLSFWGTTNLRSTTFSLHLAMPTGSTSIIKSSRLLRLGLCPNTCLGFWRLRSPSQAQAERTRRGFALLRAGKAAPLQHVLHLGTGCLRRCSRDRDLYLKNVLRPLFLESPIFSSCFLMIKL